MNRSELDRLAALQRYAGSLPTQQDLARELGLSERRIRRLQRRLEAEYRSQVEMSGCLVGVPAMELLTVTRTALDRLAALRNYAEAP